MEFEDQMTGGREILSQPKIIRFGLPFDVFRLFTKIPATAAAKKSLLFHLAIFRKPRFTGLFTLAMVTTVTGFTRSFIHSQIIKHSGQQW